MSKGNILLHKFIITKYKHVVAEYIQYADATPFDTIKVSCAVSYLYFIEAKHGKISSIIRYFN